MLRLAFRKLRQILIGLLVEKQFAKLLILMQTVQQLKEPEPDFMKN